MGVMEDQIDALNTLSESEIIIDQIKDKIVARTLWDAKGLRELLDILVSMSIKIGRIQILYENSLSDGQPNKKKEG